MSYDLETREDDRAVTQEFNSPHPVGDATTEDDLMEWKKQKHKYEEEDWREDEWSEFNARQNNIVIQMGV